LQALTLVDSYYFWQICGTELPERRDKYQDKSSCGEGGEGDISFNFSGVLLTVSNEQGKMFVKEQGEGECVVSRDLN
jgi:hypothetical protein